MKAKEIAIVGCGGFGREVKMLIDQINKQNRIWSFIGFYDDGVEVGTAINGYKVLGRIDDLIALENEINVVLALGDPKVKEQIVNKIAINNNIHFPTLIHPSVIIGEDDVEIGEGTIICAGCIITVQVSIGKHVILNLGCTVGHDSILRDFSSLMPSVNVSGEVVIEKNVFIGTGTKIINRKSIGENSIIGAGAVVSSNIPSNVTAVGIPAKPLVK